MQRRAPHPPPPHRPPVCDPPRGSGCRWRRTSPSSATMRIPPGPPLCRPGRRIPSSTAPPANPRPLHHSDISPKPFQGFLYSTKPPAPALFRAAVTALESLGGAQGPLPPPFSHLRCDFAFLLTKTMATMSTPLLSSPLFFCILHIVIYTNSERRIRKATTAEFRGRNMSSGRSLFRR